MQRPPWPGYGAPFMPAGAPYGAPSYQDVSGRPGGLPYPRPYGIPPIVGSAPRPRPSGGVMAKSTTLWVGKIAPTVEAQLIRDVLEACGPLKEWKPALDPATGGIKGFGFATFRDAEGVLVALAVLNGLTLDGQALALKCNSATEQYIKWFKDSKSKDGGAGNSENKLVGNGNESAAREKVSELVKGRASVAPPVAVTDAADAANEFLASLGQGSAQPGQENAETRSKDVTDVKRPRDVERDLPTDYRPRKKVDDRDRERQDESRRYKELLWKWEMHERDKKREREKRADREKDLRKERQRQLLADNEGYESDDAKEFWERKPYFGSRRADERRRRREQELAEEEADKHRERERALEEERKQRENAAAAEEAEKTRLAEAEAGQAQQVAGAEGMDRIDGGKGRLRARPRGSAAFGDDDKEEEEQPTRHLIPLQYTEEELQAATEGEAQPEQQRSQHAATALIAPEDIKKKIMASIPKNQEGVFAYKVKWEQIDRGPADVKERISGWIGKKIKELLGEEEPSFCEFIISQVTAHEDASQLCANLRDVLDEDADPFVMKLYQVIIYETERLAAASGAP